MKHGLVAHNSGFLTGMAGTFGSVTSGTFSCIGSSAGYGVISSGTNYNVAVDVNRADFKEDYANLVLPHLSGKYYAAATEFLRE
jgi:hypothetical protein